MNCSPLNQLLKLIVTATFLFAVNVQAQNIYCVRADATGSNNGSDWNNAFRALPASLQRGATYFVADGNYSGYTFDDMESGGTVTSIKKATESAHGPNTGWQSAFGDGQAVFGTLNIMTDNWEIDGVVGGGPGSWTSGHGIRINGSIQINPSYNPVHAWVVGSDNGGDNVTLRHLEIVGSNTPSTDDAVSNNNNEGLTLSHLYTYNTNNCPVNLFYTSNVVWEYCYHGNFTSSLEHHAEIVFLYGKGNAKIRWNVFRHVQSTGGIMVNNPDQQPVDVYGNVFYRLPTETWAYGGDGVIGGWSNRSDLVCYNVRVYNNTFINVPSDALGIVGSTPSGGLVARNNYFYSSDTGLPNGRWNADYNHFQNSGTESEANGTTGSGNPFVTLDTNSRDFAKLTAATAAGDTSVAAEYRTDWFGNVGSSRGALQVGGTPPPPDTTAPTASITAPAGGATVSGNVNLTATASDNAGGTGVSSVTFLVNGAPVGSDSTSPYSMSWDSKTAANGSVSIQVRAVDGAGNQTTSTAVTATVQNITDNVAPTVTLTAPANGATATGVLTMTATASDNTGGTGVVNVSFLVDNVIVGIDQTPPYSISWDSTTVGNGTHSVRARAVDAANNSADSAAVSISAQNGGTTLNNGLVGYWMFNETAGTTAIDSSSRENTATLVNGTAHPAGRSGSAAGFDGVDDHVRVPNAASLEPTNAVSVALWVNIQSAGDWQTLVSKVAQEGTHAFPYSAYELFIERSGGVYRARFAVTGSNGNRAYAAGTSTLNLDTWYNIVGIYDGSKVAIYVNGVEEGSSQLTGSISQNGQPLFMGRNGAGGDPFKGRLDDVRIYNRALIPNEVQTLHSATPPMPPSNLRIVPQ